MNKSTTRKVAKPSKTSCYYTIGRVVTEPTAQIGKRDKVYQTAYVECFGGMRVSALADAEMQITKNMYVCVRITPKSDGQTTYTIYELNEHAQQMLIGATAYMRAQSVQSIATQKPTVLSDELPF